LQKRARLELLDARGSLHCHRWAEHGERVQIVRGRNRHPLFLAQNADPIPVDTSVASSPGDFARSLDIHHPGPEREEKGRGDSLRRGRGGTSR
jgi:hypothetical protein